MNSLTRRVISTLQTIGIVLLCALGLAAALYQSYCLIRSSMIFAAFDWAITNYL